MRRGVALAVVAILLLAPPVAGEHPPGLTAEVEHAEAYRDFMTGPTAPNELHTLATHVLETLLELGPTAGCENAYHIELTVWLSIRRATTEWVGYVHADGVVNEGTTRRAQALNNIGSVLNFYLLENGCDV